MRTNSSHHTVHLLLASILVTLSSSPCLAGCEELLIQKYLSHEEIRTPIPSPHVKLEEFRVVLKELELDGDPLVEKALAQAILSHVKQKRDDGTSYLEQHVFPVAVSIAARLQEMGKRVRREDVAAALLHDALEDTPGLSHEIFERRFGTEVYQMVRPLTKPNYQRFPGRTKRAKKWNLNFSYIDGIGRSSAEIRLIKLADRLNNLISTRLLLMQVLERGLPVSEKIAYYIIETEMFYLPMAQTTSFYYYIRLLYHVETLKPLVPRWNEMRRQMFSQLGKATE